MNRAFVAAAAAALTATASAAQVADPSSPPIYGVVEAHVPDAAPASGEDVRELSIGFPTTLSRPDLDVSRFTAVDEERVWGVIGPFEDRRVAMLSIAALVLDAEVTIDASESESRRAGEPEPSSEPAETVDARFAATLSATPDAVLSDPDDQDGDRAYYRLWRLRFHDGGEARGAAIVHERILPVLDAIGREAIVLVAEPAERAEPAKDAADWDLLVFEGRFETAEAAQARISGRDQRYEDALLARIGDPRTVAAMRLELSTLTAGEDERVVWRRVTGAEASERD